MAGVAFGSWADWDKDVLFVPIRSTAAVMQTGATPGTCSPTAAFTQYYEDSLEPCPWWVKAQDAWPFCTICRRYVTQDHITSRAHVIRVKYYEEDLNFQAEEPNAEAQVVWDEWLRQRPSKGMSPRAKREDANPTTAAASAPSSLPQRTGTTCYAMLAGGPDPAWGDPSYFQFSQSEGWWWCKVCEKWSDDDHVKSKRHLNNISYLIKDKQTRENRAPRVASSDDEDEANGGTRKLLDPWGPDWKKERKKQNNRAKSQKGRMYRNDDDNAGYSSSASFNQVPPPWRKEWSDLQSRYYYWNPETDDTTWEVPKRMPNSATSFWC